VNATAYHPQRSRHAAQRRTQLTGADRVRRWWIEVTLTLGVLLIGG
jgi:hypothetical protein